MNVYLIAPTEIGGGAEKDAFILFQEYNKRNINAYFLVLRKKTHLPKVLPVFSEYRNNWYHFWDKIYTRVFSLLKNTPLRKASLLLGFVRELPTSLKILWGQESFNSPASWKLLELLQDKPDIIHCHNLHFSLYDTWYFDIGALPYLSSKVPVILTLHDEWLFTGQCAYTINCNRWENGCGKCPNLYPLFLRDATNYNWKRKKKIYEKSKFYIATPSQWLMNKVKKSILSEAIIESKVIPLGINTNIFTKGNKNQIREYLNIPRDNLVLLSIANSIRTNRWKDWETLKKSLIILSNQLNQEISFIGLGENPKSGIFKEEIGNVSITCLPYIKEPSEVAKYYQAADIFVLSTKSDNFPFVVIEALACGLPVIATAVGGIPEQVKSIKLDFWQDIDHSISFYSPEEATGILVPPRNPDALAKAILKLIENPEMREKMGNLAYVEAQKKYDISREANDYLTWYTQILESRKINKKTVKEMWS